MADNTCFNRDEAFADLDFHSRRLERRFFKTMGAIARQPGKSLWACSENRAEAKAIYRMLGNERLSRDEILRSHREAVGRRMAGSGSVILAVQDTTSVNYATHKKTAGIGYMSDTALGVNIHTCLAVRSDGLVLGLLDQTFYSREPVPEGAEPPDRLRSRPIEEKESARWLETLERSTRNLPETLRVVTVCDREGDMYEFYARAAQTGRLFLVRVVQNRLTAEHRLLLDAVRGRACAGRVAVRIPRDSRRNLKERDAVLQVRYGEYTVQRPHALAANKALPAALPLHIVHVQEEAPGAGAEPIEWFLATNEAVTGVEAAYERVQWYTQRWKIERFHYVLKSGCAIEKLQERSIEKSALLILLYSVVAVMIMNLTYLGRVAPALPCTVFFEREEWEVLYCAATKSKEPPEEPYTLEAAVEYLGRLGGPKRAPSDGPPGLKAVWLGFETLATLLTYREYLR